MTKFWLQISLGSDFRSEKSEKLLSGFFSDRKIEFDPKWLLRSRNQRFHRIYFSSRFRIGFVQILPTISIRFKVWICLYPFLGKLDLLCSILTLILTAYLQYTPYFCSRFVHIRLNFVCKHPYRNNQECSCFLFVFSHFKDLSLSLIFSISVRMLTHLVD